MSKDTFSFDGHVSDKTYAPYILNDSFRELPVNTILMGTVDHIIPGDKIKAQVLINGHRMSITAWGMTLDEAKALIGKTREVAFTGMSDTGWPKLHFIVR